MERLAQKIINSDNEVGTENNLVFYKADKGGYLSLIHIWTLSGAPKIRACQLINDLENNKRGIYGGAIGYLDFTGNLDTCIAIRIVYKKNGKVFVRSGAGIVYDSVLENEYTECINKAAAVVKAVSYTHLDVYKRQSQTC